MDGPNPFGTLKMVTDELRQFAALAPLATISPVSASVGATPPLSGPMPESTSPDAHVRFSVENTCTVASNATTGISELIDAALTIAQAVQSTDMMNALSQENTTGPSSSAPTASGQDAILGAPCYIPGSEGDPTIGPDAHSPEQS